MWPTYGTSAASTARHRLDTIAQGRDPEPSSAGVGRGPMVAAGRCVADRRRRSADPRLGVRFTPADRTGRWEVTGRTLEAQRRSPPRTGGAFEGARSRRSPASCAEAHPGAGPWRLAISAKDVQTTDQRARGEGAPASAPRSRHRVAAPLRPKRAPAVEASKNQKPLAPPNPTHQRAVKGTEAPEMCRDDRHQLKPDIASISAGCAWMGQDGSVRAGCIDPAPARTSTNGWFALAPRPRTPRAPSAACHRGIWRRRTRFSVEVSPSATSQLSARWAADRRVFVIAHGEAQSCDRQDNR